MSNFKPWVCKKCGTHVTNIHRVCPNCGEPHKMSAVICPKCHKPSRFVNDACVYCGADLKNQKAAFKAIETDKFVYWTARIYNVCSTIMTVCKLLMVLLFVFSGIITSKRGMTAAMPCLIIFGGSVVVFLIALLIKYGLVYVVYKRIPSDSPLLSNE